MNWIVDRIRPYQARASLDHHWAEFEGNMLRREPCEHLARNLLAAQRDALAAGVLEENGHFFLVAFCIECFIHEGRWLDGAYKDKLDESRRSL